MFEVLYRKINPLKLCAILALAFVLSLLSNHIQGVHAFSYLKEHPEKKLDENKTADIEKANNRDLQNNVAVTINSVLEKIKQSKNLTHTDVVKLVDVIPSRALLIDARPGQAYNKGHIPGATSLPNSGNMMELNQAADKIYSQNGADFPLAVYCDGGACSASIELQRFLKAFGFTGVSVYEGGMEEWLEMSGDVK